jgi:hypothetical protein
VNAFQHRPPHGQRAGFVENNGVEMRQALERLAAFEQDTQLRSAADGHGEGRWHGQSHGAGAGNHQHGDRVGHGQGKGVRGDQPDRKCKSRKSQHHGNEDGAGAVGQPLHRSARALRLLHHSGDLGQDGRFAERLGPASHSPVVVERAGQYAASRLARLWGGLAGEHGLIDRGAAYENDGVHWKALAGKDEHAVAGLNFIQRHNGLYAVHDAPRRDRLQAGEGIESRQGALLGAGFERLAQQQEAENEQYGVEVDWAVRRGEQSCVSRPGEGYAGSQAHQRIHIGRAVAQPLPGIEINPAPGPGHDCRGQGEQRPANRAMGKTVEPGRKPHQTVVQCTHAGARTDSGIPAHTHIEGHGKQHGRRACGNGGPSLARSRALLCASHRAVQGVMICAW